MKNFEEKIGLCVVWLGMEKENFYVEPIKGENAEAHSVTKIS